ncbi:hypothetical protein D3C72_2511920 [compost metagenome]
MGLYVNLSSRLERSRVLANGVEDFSTCSIYRDLKFAVFEECGNAIDWHTKSTNYIVLFNVDLDTIISSNSRAHR